MGTMVPLALCCSFLNNSFRSLKLAAIILRAYLRTERHESRECDALIETPTTLSYLEPQICPIRVEQYQNAQEIAGQFGQLFAQTLENAESDFVRCILLFAVQRCIFMQSGVSGRAIEWPSAAVIAIHTAACRHAANFCR
jgi:hypothetical protein